MEGLSIATSKSTRGGLLLTVFEQWGDLCLEGLSITTSKSTRDGLLLTLLVPPGV